MSEETGQLTEKSGEICVKWGIDNFRAKVEKASRKSQLREGNGRLRKVSSPRRIGNRSIFYTSPVFSLSDSCWRLEIRKQWSGKQQLLVHLIRQDAGPPKTVSFKITGPFVSIEGKQSFFTDCATYTKLVDLFFSISNKALIFCTLKSEDKLPLEESLFGRLWNASLSLKRILAVRENNDVVLKLKSREVRANRLIMESRFPDFARKVDDAIASEEFNIERADEEAFDIVISYVQRSEPEGLSSRNVCAVYRIAHSYGLEELLKLCKLFLVKNLSVDGVCDVIQMATRYEEEELKERAKEFFAKNSSKILETDKWKAFREENPTFHLELLECMMKDENKHQNDCYIMDTHDIH